MPLGDALPRLDDRRYADIVAEIRTRIPRYTPEWRPQWNDLNDSDPGMILAQTFAWLSEMLLFRMERVPELQYLKFLQLIGIELLPAQSATAEITFTVADAATTPTVLVPPRTQVSAASDDGAPIVFETERSLTAITAQLRSVQAYDGAVYDDVTGRNAEPSPAGPGFHPFGRLPREGGALVLGFGFPEAYLLTQPDVFVPVSIDLAVWTMETRGATLMSQCGPAATRAYAPAKLQWEGFDGTEWQSLDAINDETLAFTRTGHIVVRVPAALSLQKTYLGAYDSIDPVTKQPRPALYWIRARLVRTQYERAPHLAAVRTNTVAAIQAQTVNGEVLGGTSGARDQKWQLENRPVLKGSLRIQINEGPGEAWRDWTIVDDLFGSDRDDEHLAVNWTSGEVRAGNGEHGQVPVANASTPDTNVMAAGYRFGGGKRGNVRAGEIRNLLTPVDGIDGAKTTNIFDAAGGSDEERIEDAKVRARQTLKARERAVGTEDFELLAKQAGNVRRAKALPLTHPDFPGVKVPGAVTVIVVPDSTAPNPQPSEGLLRTVCAFLESRRLLTTELYVVGPRYVPVSVEATIVASENADLAKVREQIEAALSKYLHPLTGGDDGSGWPFGGPVRYSKVMQRVFDVDGVDSVPSLVLIVDDERRPECRDVPIDSIAPHALVHAAAHQLTIATLRELEEQP
ncbi:MAG TPA: putative baseplate assembly protein [Vicinamibacterales bacterium]